MMTASINQYFKEKIVLHGKLAEFRQALEEEIDKIKQSGQSSTLLFDGRRIESSGNDCWYRFNVEYVPTLPADTPCKLLIGKDQFDVTVISFEENTIVLSSKSPLPDTLAKARLENGATVLMERLIKRIEENAEKENPAGDRMLPADEYGDNDPFHVIASYSDVFLDQQNTASQNEAIFAALSNDITYIWGPPGTGKTTVIGQIIDELYKHHRSVLVVSHTNTAVDGAIEKADKTYIKLHGEENEQHPILRIGIPTKRMPDRVLLSAHVAALGKELYEQKTELEKKQSEIQHRINNITPQLAKSHWVNASQIPSIKNEIRVIKELEVRIAEQTGEYVASKELLNKAKASHPEYSHYAFLKRSLDAKEKEHAHTLAQIDNAEERIKRIPGEIQAAEDEMRKHDRYESLRAEESKQMSVKFLLEEISKAAHKRSAFQDELVSLKNEQTELNKRIADYEKKSTVAKFFSGKSNITQAQERLNAIKIMLPRIDNDIQTQTRLEENYKKQLSDLIYLQEQIKAVVPAKTKAFWNYRVKELTAQLHATQTELPQLQERNVLLTAEVATAENKTRAAENAMLEIKKLESNVLEIYKALQMSRDNYNVQNSNCSTLLEKECSLCAAFYYECKGESISNILDELNALLESVKSEVAGLDIFALKAEKETLQEQLLKIYSMLAEIQQKMQELEKQAIMHAEIVGATLAKSYLSDTLRERTFDTVILDEASMASIPALWCACYLAEKSIVIVGDFLQLPPIVMADTPMAQKWLGSDIFYLSGVQDKARHPETKPANFIMLNDQFRMESEIANIANMYYGEYGGLRSNDATEWRQKEREEFYGWYSGEHTKHCIHLIDMKSLHAWVTGVPQGKRHSRLNCFSATVDVDLAFKFLENKLNEFDPQTAKPLKEASVLIIAPYKPHVERLKKLIELEYKNRGFKENLNLIRAGTIHGFQGGEADIVIFDLVIDEPHWKANLFMTDKAVNEDLRKMFNVAVTRAKFKLYIVGNFSYCQKRAKNNALAQLLERLIVKDKLPKIDAKELLPNIVFAAKKEYVGSSTMSERHILCREESFNDYFMADIKAFKHRLIIYSPFITENRLSNLLPDFQDAISAGKQIIIVTKALSDRGKSEISQYEKCEKELKVIGITVIHKKGMHEKLIVVDDDAVWIGSLNALSYTGLTGEVMHRHLDHDLTSEYEKLFDIERICEVVEKTNEQCCPICGGEMIIGESDNGGVYWTCVNKDYSRRTDQQYPADGILRCKCGAPYIFSMKNQPRWVCSENPAHYQLVRESDLKLGKMAALIPTKKELYEVERYFAARRKEHKTQESTPLATKKKTGKL